MECPAEWKKKEFVIIPKAGDSLECSNYPTIALISHTSNTLLYKILIRLKKKVEIQLADEHFKLFEKLAVEEWTLKLMQTDLRLKPLRCSFIEDYCA